MAYSGHAMATNSNLYALVMAGGQGTRFWPASTSKRPKQFLNLASKHSLLYETLVRFDGLIPQERRFVVTVDGQAQLVRDCAGDMMANEGIILEPSGRNTAPCILLGLHSLLQRGATPHDVVAITPSDHVVNDKKAFCQVVEVANRAACELNKIVTIGIPPTHPHTGFGYIRRGEELGQNIYCAERFVEKPDLPTAQSYLQSGDYYWNAGIFVSTVETLLREFAQHAPEIYRHGENLQNCGGDFAKLTEAYGQIPADSIDYAIMEKSREVALIPATFDWNDLGSWDALDNIHTPRDGNTVATCRDAYTPDSKGNIVYAPDRFVSLVGVDNLIVVADQHSVMVLPKSKAQEIKDVVEFMKTQDHLKDLL